MPVAATAHFAGNVDLVSVVPIPLLLLAALGAWASRREAWAAPLRWSAALAALNAGVVLVAGFAFFMFHQRSFFFLGLAAALLGAVGVGALMDRLARGSRWGARLAAGMIVAALFFGYFRVPGGTGLYRLVNEDDRQAIEWLGNQPALAGLAVIAPAPVGTIITPLARLRSKITFLTSQNLEARANPRALAFETADCVKKEQIVIEQGAGIVYAKMPQECAFLEEIYRSAHTFIYRRVGP